MNGPTPAEPNPEEEPRTERLAVTTLRRAKPVRLWGGKGCGAPCDFCRVLVAATEIEYEVEAELDGARVTLHFHPRCHDAWRAEAEVSSPVASAPPRMQTPA